MHYFDDEHRNQNLFRFVVYKHGDWCKKKKIFHAVGEPRRLNEDMSNVQLQALYELTSIQQCQFVEPSALWRFMQTLYSRKGFHRMMQKHLRSWPFEAWYLFTMKHDLNGELKVVGFEKVDADHTSFLCLH